MERTLRCLRTRSRILILGIRLAHSDLLERQLPTKVLLRHPQSRYLMRVQVLNHKKVVVALINQNRPFRHNKKHHVAASARLRSQMTPTSLNRRAMELLRCLTTLLRPIRPSPGIGRNRGRISIRADVLPLLRT